MFDDVMFMFFCERTRIVSFHRAALLRENVSRISTVTSGSERSGGVSR